MIEPMPDATPPERTGARPEQPATAGSLLKAAREREGLHLAVLAATIKVAPAKLEALEKDRYGDLPNATFARALAQSVCRSLKIDPRPVLALLPQVETPPLEGAMGSLNTPFQERPSRTDGNGLAWASKPMFWTGGLLLLAAVVVGLLPPDLIDNWRSGPPPMPAEPAAAPALAASAVAALAAASAASATLVSEAASAAASAVAAAASAPAVAASMPAADDSPATATAASAPPAAAPPLGLVSFTATAASWVEVLDAQGKPVFEKLLRPGEVVSLDATPPLRVRVGNAGGTTLTFRGQMQDLAPYTRNNVARIELR